MFKDALIKKDVIKFIVVSIMVVLGMIVAVSFYDDPPALYPLEMFIVFIIIVLLLSIRRSHKYFNKIFENQNIEVMEQQYLSEINSGNFVEFKPIILTPTFIYTKKNGYGIHYSSNLMMAYGKLTKHKSYGITTAKKHSVVLYFANNTIENIDMLEDSVVELLEYFKKYYPYTILGYNSDLEKLYINNFDKFKDGWIKHNSKKDVQN